MATLRDLRKRIRSVRSTQKITKAMKMVAAAKLRRAQERLMSARPYAQKIMETVLSLASRVDPGVHPLLSVSDDAKKILVLVVTSDRGLCAGFNSNILRAVEANARKWRGSGYEIEFVAVGKKGRDYLKSRRYSIHQEHIQTREVTYEKAGEIGDAAISAYKKGDVREVYIVFNHFRSAMSQRPLVEKLLPFTVKPERGPGSSTAVNTGASPSQPGSGGSEGISTAEGVDFLYEPSRTELVEFLIPRAIRFQVYRALLESYAGEQGARMTAMDSATNNATEMIDSLTLTMNKARQAAITKELMEIVNGAEALRR